MNPNSALIPINKPPLSAHYPLRRLISTRMIILGMSAAVGLLFSGCAAYPGAVFATDGGYSGPYYGDYGPYDGGDIIVGGYRHGGHYGDHHFTGSSFGHQGSSHGGGGGSRGGGGSHSAARGGRGGGGGGRGR